MPLTPAVHDPNRKRELMRRKKDPHSFGTDGAVELPKGWKSNQLSGTAIEQPVKEIVEENPEEVPSAPEENK